jgi:hypothetical protein
MSRETTNRWPIRPPQAGFPSGRGHIALKEWRWQRYAGGWVRTSGKAWSDCPGDRQADRADQSVEAGWLGHDWGSTRNGTHARTSRVAERIRKREIEHTFGALLRRRGCTMDEVSPVAEQVPPAAIDKPA